MKCCRDASPIWSEICIASSMPPRDASGSIPACVENAKNRKLTASYQTPQAALVAGSCCALAPKRPIKASAGARTASLRKRLNSEAGAALLRALKRAFLKEWGPEVSRRSKRKRQRGRGTRSLKGSLCSSPLPRSPEHKAEVHRPRRSSTLRSRRYMAILRYSAATWQHGVR